MDYKLIGLSNRDKRVYEALLQSPQASVRLIAEMTGINRGSVFESIKALVGAGLVTHVQTGERKRYSAQDPEMIHEIINDKRRALRDMHGITDRYIKSLALERDDPSAFQFASFYDGDEGLAHILRDVLTTARRDGFSDYYSISSPRVSEHLYNNFPRYSSERVKMGLGVKVIGLGKPLRKQRDFVERRILPGDGHDTGVYSIIYGNKVAIATVDQYRHASGIIIDNTGVAALQKILFEQTWDRLGYDCG